MIDEIAIEELANAEGNIRKQLLEELDATPNEELLKLTDEWRTLNFDCSIGEAMKGKRNKDKIECADELDEIVNKY